jgi:hypothetical protein
MRIHNTGFNVFRLVQSAIRNIENGENTTFLARALHHLQEGVLVLYISNFINPNHFHCRILDYQLLTCQNNYVFLLVIYISR